MIETPFTQGSRAFLDDEPTVACSFAKGSTMHREWVDGWSDRQMRERAHRSRALATMNLTDLLGDPASGAMAKLFRPIHEFD